jgi:hypothetical protein
MIPRTFVTVLALSALLCLPGLRLAAAGAGERLMAQSETPLTVPPAASGTTAPPASQPATPPATTTSPATPPAAPSVAPGAGEATPPAGAEEPGTAGEDNVQDNGESPDSEELSLGEIPIIETVELTPDSARRALDSYIALREKYANSELDQYENLQDFVDQTAEGKSFEADIKAAGFANVTDWNLAITTLGLVYGSIIDDQTQELLQQIKEVEEDGEMAQDIKDRMVKALKALIPSDNNRKVVEGMLEDAVYRDKLKLLDLEEE